MGRLPEAPQLARKHHTYPKRRMEIFFCDICNESVPEGDLSNGLAYRRGSRVVCAPCDRAMSPIEPVAGSIGLMTKPQVGTDTEVETSAPAIQGRKLVMAAAPAGPAASGAGGVLIALLVLVFGAAGFALMLEKLDELDDRTDTKVATLRGRFGGIKDQLGQSDLLNLERLASVEARMSGDRATALSAIQAGIEGLRVQITANDGRFETIAADLQRIRGDQSDGLAVLEGQVSSLGQQLLDVERSARETDTALAELEGSIDALLRAPLVGGPGPVIGSGELNPDGGTPPWDGLLPDLAHTNAGLRLDAVYALGETKDSRVVPHLVSMLKDEDLFVRMATTHVLVDLDAKLAVPNLIDTLEDDSSPVREAAMVALRDLTSQNFQFEPLGTNTARKKRIDDWRSWWKRNGDDFLTGSA
jgi:hypothetical protein